jgi:hypothetical protein
MFCNRAPNLATPRLLLFNLLDDMLYHVTTNDMVVEIDNDIH